MEIPRKKTSAANVFHRTDAGDCWDSRIKKERPGPFRTGAAPGQVLNGETWHNLHLIIFPGQRRGNQVNPYRTGSAGIVCASSRNI